MAQGRSTKIISMIMWTRTSRLSIKVSLSGLLARRERSLALTRERYRRAAPVQGVGFRVIPLASSVSASGQSG